MEPIDPMIGVKGMKPATPHTHADMVAKNAQIEANQKAVASQFDKFFGTNTNSNKGQ